MIAFIPQALRAVTAVSREDPQPKLFPAIIKSSFLTVLAKFGRCSMKAILANSFASVVILYRPGVIRSVFILFPKIQFMIIF